MGTLSITYNGTTKTYTQSGAPVVTYGGVQGSQQVVGVEQRLSNAPGNG